MVGVPGRSKGCKTCKKRKIACSLERPHCKICIKSKRECLGYDQERTFILDQRTRKQILKFETNELPLDTPPAKTHSAPDSRKELIQLEGAKSTRNDYYSLWRISSPSMCSVYRQQIISEFLYSSTPGNPIQESPTKHNITKNWFTLLPSHPDFTTALEATVLAICTARLGRLNNDPALVHESLKFYVQGLWELQRALYTTELMYKDETAASCLALVFYEVMECPDQTVQAWKKHVHGCAKLFELRGPKAYSTVFGHQLFLTFREMEIQQAISEKRRTFLSSPEWNTQPWKGHTKPLPHYLLDLQAEMANELAFGFDLLSAPGAVENPLSLLPPIVSLIQRTWKIDIRLQAFYKRLENSTLGPLYWARLSNGFNRSIQGEEGDELFPVAFQFGSLETARTCMVYWATQAILWSGLRFVYSLLGSFAPLPCLPTPESPFPAPFPGLPSLDHRSDPTSAAKNICQSVEYCIQQSPGSGAILTVFPLKVAIETFGDARDCGCDRDFEWAKGVIERIGGSGVTILAHLDRPVEEHAFIPSPSRGEG